MRRGQKVRLSMRLNGAIQVLQGKVTKVDGTRVWVLWDGRREPLEVFLDSLEAVRG